MTDKSNTKPQLVADEPKKSRAQLAMEFVKSKCELYRDDEHKTYAAFVNPKGAREFWFIGSPSFKDIVGEWYYRDQGQALTSDILKEVCEMLCAQARYGGELCTAHQRVARMGDCYYIDLCDDKWRQVEVSANGFRVLASGPAMFVRTKRMRDLPVPEQHSDLAELWKYIRLQPEEQPLLLAWMLECFRPETAYPILELTGGQGTGKTIMSQMIKLLVDPAKPLLQARTKSSEDLFISAKSNHLVAIENLSYLNEDMQDSCCQIATGSGMAKRQLYSDFEESAIEVKAPLLLNGIVHLATRPDMISRTIKLSLRPITGNKRMTERSLMDEFHAALPRLFGALLNLLSTALANPVRAEDYELPRLSDFALLGEAVSQSQGNNLGYFIRRLNDNQQKAKFAVIGANPFIEIVIDIAKNSIGEVVYSGTCGNLYKITRAKLDYMGGSFPASSNQIKNCLKRHEDVLADHGIRVEYPERKNTGYHITIIKDVSSDKRSLSVVNSG